eukprot:7715406-Pyramimonas_sp.AAC.1
MQTRTRTPTKTYKLGGPRGFLGSAQAPRWRVRDLLTSGQSRPGSAGGAQRGARGGGKGFLERGCLLEGAGLASTDTARASLRGRGASEKPGPLPLPPHARGR